MAAEPNDSPGLTPGLVVCGDRAALVRAFATLVPLQPVAWTAEGLVCSPRAGSDTHDAPRVPSPLSTRRLPHVPGWPSPPAQVLAGWYVRSPDHAPAPAGLRELVVVPGDGFGLTGHVTTAMCLAALDTLPALPALDIGCGAGLLTQAWLRLGRGPVEAVDLDGRAVAHARGCLAAAGFLGRVHLVQGPAEHHAGRVAGRVLLANLPLAGHLGMLACMHAPPAAVVLSGLRPGQSAAVRRGYTRLGLRSVSAHRRAAWECWVMAR